MKYLICPKCGHKQKIRDQRRRYLWCSVCVTKVKFKLEKEELMEMEK